MNVLLLLAYLGFVCLCGAGAAIASDYIKTRL